MVGFVEATGRRHGVEHPMQMTVATTDGDHDLGLPLLQRAREPRRSSTAPTVATLRAMYPDNDVFHRLSDETRLIVSEPLGELVGAWQPVPESSYGIVQKSGDSLGQFRPVAP